MSYATLTSIYIHTGGDDYIPSSQVLSFDLRMFEELQCTSISTIDDGAVESDEEFSVFLIPLGSDVIVNSGSAIITIVDNDGMCVCNLSYYT